MYTAPITEFIKGYGWQLALVALIGIIFVGTLKGFNAFKKVKKEYRKFIYYPVSTILAVLCCVGYMFLFRKADAQAFAVLDWVWFCVAIMSYSVTVYAVYENIGLRNLWLGFLSAVKKGIVKLIALIQNKTMSVEAKKKLAISLGTEVLTETVKEAKAIEDQKSEVHEDVKAVTNKYPNIFQRNK